MSGGDVFIETPYTRMMTKAHTEKLERAREEVAGQLGICDSDLGSDKAETIANLIDAKITLALLEREG